MSNAVDSLLTKFSLLGYSLKSGDDRHQQLHNYGRSDVWINAQGGHTEVLHSTTSKKVKHAKERSFREVFSQGLDVHAGQRNVRHKTEDYKDADSEKNFSPQIRQCPYVHHCLDKSRSGRFPLHSKPALCSLQQPEFSSLPMKRICQH